MGLGIQPLQQVQPSNFAQNFSLGRQLGNQIGLQQNIGNVLGDQNLSPEEQDLQLSNALLKSGQIGTGIQLRQLSQQKAQQQQQAQQQVMGEQVKDFFGIARTLIQKGDQQGLSSLTESLKTSDNSILSELGQNLSGIQLEGDNLQIKTREITSADHPLLGSLVQSGAIQEGVSVEVEAEVNAQGESKLKTIKFIEEEGPEKGTFKFDPKTRTLLNTATGEIRSIADEIGLPSADPEVQFNQEQQLRTQFQGLTKDFRIIRDSFGRIRSIADDNSGASDLSFIFNFMKINDPGSVVRESEFKNAASARAELERVEGLGISIPSKILQIRQKIKTGGFLTPKQRKDFLFTSRSLFESGNKQFKQTENEYKKIANSYNLQGDRVVGNIGLVKEEEPEPEPEPEIQTTQTQTNLEQQLGRQLTPAEIEELRRRGLN